jgi:hypothetical protein
MTKQLPRFYVHTRLSGIGNVIRDPHQVIDRMNNEVIDEYTSKKAAQMDCDTLNRVEGQAL